jgi:hypothetical protein
MQSAFSEAEFVGKDIDVDLETDVKQEMMH